MPSFAGIGSVPSVPGHPGQPRGTDPARPRTRRQTFPQFRAAKPDNQRFVPAGGIRFRVKADTNGYRPNESDYPYANTPCPDLAGRAAEMSLYVTTSLRRSGGRSISNLLLNRSPRTVTNCQIHCGSRPLRTQGEVQSREPQLDGASMTTRTRTSRSPVVTSPSREARHPEESS